VLHLGDVQRTWARIIGAGGGRPDEIELPDPPDDRAGMVEWFTAGTAELVDAIGRVDPAAPAWTWWGEPATAGAIARHQVQEASVHRVDAELSTGTSTPLDPDVAHDGVEEFLQIMLGGDAAGLPPVRLRANDTGGDWPVAGPGELATITATASDLVLLLYRRIAIDRVSIDGDRSAAYAFVAAASTE
jgi:uncharacterized protein (TIGR03083 family)